MADAPERSSESHAAERSSPAARRGVAGALLGMSSWKKKLLGLFLLVAALGAVMRAPAWLDSDPPRTGVSDGDGTVDAADEATGTADNALAPPGAGSAHARGFVDSTRRPSGTAAPSDAPPAEPAPGDVQGDAESEADLPWTAHLGGWMAKLGLSFAGGLVLGVFFRAFLKTMAAITAIVVTGLVLLSYFEILNVDFTTMKTNYDTYADWLGEQAWRLKDMVSGVLPSALALGVGFFTGFVRK